MTTITVNAYFYSDEEKALILEHLTPIAETESSILGTLEPSALSLLKKESILIDMQRDPSETQPLSARNFRTEVKGARSVQVSNELIIKSAPSTDNTLYIVELLGPLITSWKDKLIAADIEIRELIGRNTYTVKTSNPEALAQLDFITAFRSSGLQDKDLITSKSVLADDELFGLGEPRVAIYDIRLHKDVEAVALLEFLDGMNCEVLEKSKNKIRVKLSSEAEMVTIGNHVDVYAIEEYIPPKLYNDLAREIIHIDVADEDDFLPEFTFTGAGEIVGIADTGIDKEHPDLKTQLRKATAWGRKDDTSDPNGHGTHVAGSVAGNGNASNGKIKGIAPEAALFFQSLLDKNGGISGLPHDLADLFKEAYEAGVRIHNNSWGAATESEYRFNSLEVDDFVYNNKDMLIVISAGNEGTAAQPRNAATGFVDWLSIGSPATAKNALTVGASRSSRTVGGFSMLTHGQAWPNKYPDAPISEVTISGDENGIAGFSSRGPCGNESRIKPDVVAPGTDIASARSSEAPSTNFWGPYPKNRNYAFMGGTSMSAPIVTGFAALIREYLRVKRDYATPSAALLKAIIVNSTRSLQGEDALADHAQTPNFHQGFGCVDMLNILPSSKNEKLALHFLDTWQQEQLQFNSTGQRFLFRFKATEGTPLRLCLTWTDPPGRGLQNNLNLLLMQVSDRFKWVGNDNIPRMITDFDRDNNVEVIQVDDPQTGEYRLVIQASNLLVGQQDFALCITGDIENELEQIN